MEPTKDGNISDNDSLQDSDSSPIDEEVVMANNINDTNDINDNNVNTNHSTTLSDAELVRLDVAQISETDIIEMVVVIGNLSYYTPIYKTKPNTTGKGRKRAKNGYIMRLIEFVA